ncbi:MAG TPA: conjugal transfer protein [Candidatus Accumulibacter sp.]|nr:conjugal transfer protein [Accumulibacter sp.]
MPRPQPLRERIKARIQKSRDTVFLTREFKAMADEDQVIRALRQLVADGELVRLGYGVYGRAERSSLTGKPMLSNPNGFSGAAREALNKLGVAWRPSHWEEAYNSGQSTQVPVNAILRVKGRFSRQLSYQNRPLMLEKKG